MTWRLNHSNKERAMKKVLGLFAAITLLGGSAFGGEAKGDKSADVSDPASDSALMTGSDSTVGTGGSGTSPTTDPSSANMGRTTPSTDTSSTTMTSSDTSANQELSGKVVRVLGKTLYIEHMGAIVPIKVSASTKFDDPSLKKAKDIKEGQEIRASFTVQNKTDNLATNISLATSGTGGSGALDPEGTGGSGMSGSEVDSSATDINSGSMPAEPQGSQPLPEEPGTQSPNQTY
jgi:hypothetical protein